MSSGLHFRAKEGRRRWISRVFFRGSVLDGPARRRALPGYSPDLGAAWPGGFPPPARSIIAAATRSPSGARTIISGMVAASRRAGSDARRRWRALHGRRAPGGTRNISGTQPRPMSLPSSRRAALPALHGQGRPAAPLHLPGYGRPTTTGAGRRSPGRCKAASSISERAPNHALDDCRHPPNSRAEKRIFPPITTRPISTRPCLAASDPGRPQARLPFESVLFDGWRHRARSAASLRRRRAPTAR